VDSEVQADRATTIADPAQPVFAIDHDIQNTSPENLAKYAKIERSPASTTSIFTPRAQAFRTR